MEALRKVIFAAVLAGLAAGVWVTLLHQVLTVPLILQAETFETPAAQHASTAAWHPHSLLERRLGTAISDVLTGIGFALVLMALWLVRGEQIVWRQGVAWGIGGFLATTVAPSLGLPAELPGSAAAALNERQLWWALTVGLTALGLGLISFAHPWWLKALGLVSLSVPHLVGAPQPLAAASLVPHELERTFQQAVLVCNFLFWVALGAAASYSFRRLRVVGAS